MAGAGGGADDNTAQGGHLVTLDDVRAQAAYQGHGSNIGEMGTLRAGNGGVTGGVPFLATTHALTVEGADASADGTGRGTPLVPVAYALRADPGRPRQGHNTNYVPVDLAQVTSAANRSNPQEGDPAGTLAATSRPAVAFNEALGNSVHEEVAPTIRSGTGGAATSVVAAAVRRLTPVECERLQGFPDGWTAKRIDLVRVGNRWEPSGKGEVLASDSVRYRQLGNSIAVPVFAWVARRMAQQW